MGLKLRETGENRQKMCFQGRICVKIEIFAPKCDKKGKNAVFVFSMSFLAVHTASFRLLLRFRLLESSYLPPGEPARYKRKVLPKLDHQ